ncbi:MAG: hypothetical protein ABSG43_24495 [Solirubrobacteraceae bacterium]
MLETLDELRDLQRLLDQSAATAGAHLRSITTAERRLDAREVCDRLADMRLIVVATVTAVGGRCPAQLTATSGEALAVTVYGQAELFELSDPAASELRQAMLDHYLPLQGPSFQVWLDDVDALGARIHADRMFTFHSADCD